LHVGLLESEVMRVVERGQRLVDLRKHGRALSVRALEVDGRLFVDRTSGSGCEAGGRPRRVIRCGRCVRGRRGAASGR
jgi:hypothetical protein